MVVVATAGVQMLMLDKQFVSPLCSILYSKSPHTTVIIIVGDLCCRNIS